MEKIYKAQGNKKDKERMGTSNFPVTRRYYRNSFGMN